MTQWGLDALFNPAKRHQDEEKLRLQSTREQIGDSSGGKRIDLDSGKVRIPRRVLDANAVNAEVAAADGVEIESAGVQEPPPDDPSAESESETETDPS